MNSHPSVRTLKAASLMAMAAVVVLAARDSADLVDIESGAVTFESATNMPGVEVKGKSTSLRGQVEIARVPNGLALQRIDASVPVNSLATGMSVRDEHMRKYVFVTADGKLPDVHFAAESSTCAGTAPQFTCQISGDLSIRGVSKPFTMSLKVKEQRGSSPAFRAAGDSVVKLSDYGIAPPSQFGVKPVDEVKLRLDFTGKQKGTATSSLGARQ